MQFLRKNKGIGPAGRKLQAGQRGEKDPGGALKKVLKLRKERKLQATEGGPQKEVTGLSSSWAREQQRRGSSWWECRYLKREVKEGTRKGERILERHKAGGKTSGIGVCD